MSRPPKPQNLEAESAVLGSMLIEPNAVQVAHAALTPADFFSERNAFLYQAMLAVADRGEPVSLMTLRAELERPTGNYLNPAETFYDRFGGADTLIALMNATASAALVGHYAELVKRESLKRQIAERAKEVYKLVRENPDALDIIAKQYEQFDLPQIARQAKSKAIAPRSFRAGLVSAYDLPQGKEPERLWFALYPGSLHYFIGETGAGKSSVFYNLAIHAARNEPLWGVPFGLLRPLNVLILDPENAGNWEEGVGGVCALRLDRINAGRPRNLYFHDWRNCDLNDPRTQADYIECLCDLRIDVSMLDPIANIFSTQDENNNAEAAKQMKILTAITRQTKVAIILCHHVGKAEGNNYGRGASARMAAADVGIVFRARSSSEDIDDDYTGEKMRQRDDLCRLQVVKNRWEGRASLYLRMTGDDKFERVKHSDWTDAADNGSTISPKFQPPGGNNGQTPMQKLYQAKEEITAILAADPGGLSSTSIIAQCQAKNIGVYSVRNALREMQSDDQITSVRAGHNILYRLTEKGLINNDDDGQIPYRESAPSSSLLKPSSSPPLRLVEDTPETPALKGFWQDKNDDEDDDTDPYAGDTEIAP